MLTKNDQSSCVINTSVPRSQTKREMCPTHHFFAETRPTGSSTVKVRGLARVRRDSAFRNAIYVTRLVSFSSRKIPTKNNVGIADL